MMFYSLPYYTLRIQGRNLNAEHWNMINSKVINVTINCSNNLKFCVLFQLTDSSAGKILYDNTLISETCNHVKIVHYPRREA